MYKNVLEGNSSLIIEETLGNISSVISLFRENYFNIFSEDEKYFFIGGYGFVEIYENKHYCAFNNCVECSDSITCIKCDEANNYFLNSSELCELCSLANCLTCFNLTYCLDCNETDDYFIEEDG